jgi:hypothetical protein
LQASGFLGVTNSRQNPSREKRVNEGFSCRHSPEYSEKEMFGVIISGESVMSHDFAVLPKLMNELSKTALIDLMKT